MILGTRIKNNIYSTIHTVKLANQSRLFENVWQLYPNRYLRLSIRCIVIKTVSVCCCQPYFLCFYHKLLLFLDGKGERMICTSWHHPPFSIFLAIVTLMSVLFVFVIIIIIVIIVALIKSDLGIKDTIAKNEDDVPSCAQSGREALIEKFIRSLIKYSQLCYCWCFSSVLFFTYFSLIQSPIR